MNIKQSKINIPVLIVCIIHFIILCFVSNRIFTNAPFEFFVPIPLDDGMGTFYFIVTKILVFIVLFLFYQFLYYLYKEKKNKAVMLNFLLPFVIILAFYIINFLICYPGHYNIDDRATYALARHYMPYYWQNYIISLFTMVGLHLAPFTSGQMLLLQGIMAFVFSYLFFRLSQVLEGKKIKWVKYLFFIFAFMPFMNLITLTTFRPYVYSILNIFVIGYLIFEKLQKKDFNKYKLIGLAFAFGVLAFWRSESIIYLIFAPILIYFAYAKQLKLKNIVIFIVLTFISYGVVNIPQKIGNEKYYLNDYLIVSTTRPLSVLLNINDTYQYKNIYDDLNNIDSIIDSNHIAAIPLTCTSYQSYNTTVNNGMLSQTFSTKEQQSKYIKSFLNIILNNKENFLKERLDLFIRTNMLENYFSIDFKQDFVRTKEPNLSSYWIFEQELRVKNEAPQDVANIDYFRAITATNDVSGYSYIYIGIPYIILALILLVISAIKKGWFMFFLSLCLVLREGIIFLTSPDVMIYYYMPITVIITFIYILMIIFGISNKNESKKTSMILLETREV